MRPEIERAWYVFAVSPDHLSPRMYRTYVRAWNVDAKIARLRERNEWPPRVSIRERWPDLANLLRQTGAEHDYTLTLDDEQLQLIAEPLRIR